MLEYYISMPNQFSRPWTEEEISFLKESIHNLTYKQMGEVISRSPASIQSKIRFLPFQQKIKKHSVNSDFFKKWSSEMSYVLGFIAADGNICHSGRAHTLHIACDDQDVIEKIKIVINYIGPVHQKNRDNGKTSYSLRICDPVMFNDLQNLGITERKSLTFTPPIIPPAYIHDFLRGFFDGDGSVSLKKTHYPSKLVVDFYTASKPMANYVYKQMRDLLKDLYKGRILIHLAHQKTPYYVIHLGHNAGKKLFEYMYNGSTLYLERKHRKFLEGLNHDN